MEFLIYFMHVFNLNNIRMKKKRTKWNWKYSKYKLTCNFKRVQKYYKRMQRCLSRSRTCPLTPWLISLWMSQPRTMHVISWWSIYLTRQIKITHYFWITLHPCHSRIKNSKGKMYGSSHSVSHSLLATHFPRRSKSISRLDNESPDEKSCSVFIELTWATCLRSAPSVIWITLPVYRS